MFQVAVYGKGGIGKSTMSANISVALAGRGLKVMQIGCDPKHDSTRLLLDGKAQRTVLDYVREVPIGKRDLNGIIATGTAGVLCAEAGGPEPGIGCAGRGILTTFDTLRKLGADDLDVDVRIYDVLGDVVCGGFAVPLRNEYADAVVLVTSGEFMAMYAANNIMRGLSNFDTGKPRMLGIVLNSRGVDGEYEAVKSFAEATGTRILAVVPRDGQFAEAESLGHTVVELFPESVIAREIGKVADSIVDACDGRLELTSPHPLDDDQLSDLAAGRAIRPYGDVPVSRIGCGGCRRTTIEGTRVMGSCAAYGAVSAFLRLEDTAVVVHGPVSCSYLMETTRAKAMLEMYSRGVFRRSPRINVRSTMMDDESAIFGGNLYLKACLERTIAEGYSRIAVVTTCMSGIIGDDCLSIVDAVMESNPSVEIFLVRADGDMTGEYNDGFMMAAESIVETVDTGLEPDGSLVNLVSSSFFDVQSVAHRKELDRMLGAFGMRVNCMFLDEGSPRPPSEICRAGVDVLMNDTPTSRELMGMITRRTGRLPFPAVMPVGMHDYLDWMRQMGAWTGRSEDAEREIARATAEYRGFLDAHRDTLRGRTAIVVSRIGTNLDWLVDVLEDMGVSVLRYGFFPSARKAGGRQSSRHDHVDDYTDDDLMRDLEELRPDLMIGGIVRQVPEGTVMAKMNRIGVGYRPVLEYVEYLENTLRLPGMEGWRGGGRS